MLQRTYGAEMPRLDKAGVILQFPVAAQSGLGLVRIGGGGDIGTGVRSAMRVARPLPSAVGARSQPQNSRWSAPAEAA